MKDIFFYKKSKSCSVKPISNNESDRLYLANIIFNIFNLFEYGLIISMRLYYGIEKSIASLNPIKDYTNNLFIDKNLFLITYAFEGKRYLKNIINNLCDMWFEFEQPCFIFSVEPLSQKTFDNITPNKLTDFLKRVQAPYYILYKSVEDDVIWIDKSKDMVWNIFPANK